MERRPSMWTYNLLVKIVSSLSGPVAVTQPAVIYLVGGGRRSIYSSGAGWGRKSYPCVLPALLSSADINNLPKGIIGALPQPISRFSRWSCPFLYYACVCFKLLVAINGLSIMFGVAVVIWFFAADTLPLSFFDECFVVVPTRADTLPLMSLRASSPPPSLADPTPLMPTAKGVMAPLLRILCRVHFGG